MATSPTRIVRISTLVAGRYPNLVLVEIETADGSFWHAIVHRQEPDAGNSAYWFRRVGAHAVFPELAAAAAACDYAVGKEWDPFALIDYCEQARRHPGSRQEHVALEVQRAEWQLLFDYCATAV